MLNRICWRLNPPDRLGPGPGGATGFVKAAAAVCPGCSGTEQDHLLAVTKARPRGRCTGSVHPSWMKGVAARPSAALASAAPLGPRSWRFIERVIGDALAIDFERVRTGQNPGLVTIEHFSGA